MSLPAVVRKSAGREYMPYGQWSAPRCSSFSATALTGTTLHTMTVGRPAASVVPVYTELAKAGDVGDSKGVEVRGCCLCGPRWCCGSRLACLIWAFAVLYAVLCLVGFILQHVLVFPGWQLALDGQCGLTIDVPVGDSFLKGVVAEQPANTVLREERTPVVFFGGNGMQMYDSQYLAGEVLGTLAGFEGLPSKYATYSISYPGYPPNSGWTTRDSIREACLGLFDLALKNMSAGNRGVAQRVLVAGWSLGAAAALQVASHRGDQVAGVLLLSPWSTLMETSHVFLQHVGSFVDTAIWPISWVLLIDLFSSVEAVSAMPRQVPLAIMSPQADSMIPAWQHRVIFEASPSNRKVLVPVPGAEHNSFQDILETMMRDGTEDPAGISFLDWALAVAARLRPVEVGADSKLAML